MNHQIKKVSGPDNIPSRIVGMAGEDILMLFCKYVNALLEENSQLVESSKIPIFKGQ